ncbi:hypothetical protein L596_022961 [Steinernema carpocapsae]|uniref:ShKT domain-containing protein n=1 Tax=Steinernema carpocapsae TaxID=34508 RepID=A0A4U5MC56_STECR|nr:hypothetical protein L596_022961 [Steinernema carpocapsae]
MRALSIFLIFVLFHDSIVAEPEKNDEHAAEENRTERFLDRLLEKALNQVNGWTSLGKRIQLKEAPDKCPDGTKPIRLNSDTDPCPAGYEKYPEGYPQCCPDSDFTSTGPNAYTSTTTTTPSCFDKTPTCRRNRRFCLDTRFFDYMRENCRETCDFCSPVNTKCLDDPSMDCDTFARNGFCRSRFYAKYGQQRSRCPVTCGKCSFLFELPLRPYPFVVPALETELRV